MLQCNSAAALSEKKSKFAAVMEHTVTIHGKIFGTAISADKIALAVQRISEQMSRELGAVNPLFVCLLNGSFIFAADLLRALDFSVEISFVKLTSYRGMVSSGELNTLIGLNENVSGRTVILIEDIIDSGDTIARTLSDLRLLGATDVRIATLLFKPAAFRHSYKIDYIGFEIANDFVVGYGMDYDGAGRNLKDIYQLI